jgi:hypothetical protein
MRDRLARMTPFRKRFIDKLNQKHPGGSLARAGPSGYTPATDAPFIGHPGD